MSTGLVYDDRFLLHDTGSEHPERPQRLRAVIDSLKVSGFWDRMVHIEATPAPLELVYRVHEPAYLEQLREACEAGQRFMDDPDCPLSRKTYELSLLAAGGVMAAVDAVVAGRCGNAFCAVRPPGHHAERNRAMGFCYVNNIAVAAEHLIHRHGLQRIAIVDFDVHHGNGTQHAFESRDDVFFVSLHEHPAYLYPGTGLRSEVGTASGNGHTLNVPFPPHAGDEQYQEAFTSEVIPALDAFKPQFVLVSAGFDAAHNDPLAHMEVSPDGFAWMTRRLCEIAQRHSGGRLVSVLEGGYDLESLAASVSKHVGCLLESA